MKNHRNRKSGKREPFRFTFNKAIGPIESDANITSDAGALMVREIVHRLGIDKMLDKLDDPRNSDYIRYSLQELIIHRVAMLVQGYSAQDDADKLAHDPAFRVAGWDRSGVQCLDERLASQPTLSRLLNMIKTDANFSWLCEIAAAAFLAHLALDIGNGNGCKATADIDGFPREAYGKQEKAAYNGYHGQKEFYPLIGTLSLDGDFETGVSDGVIAAKLRAGNASGAEDAVEFIDEILDRSHARFPRLEVDFRFDAAFTIADVINHLDSLGVKFTGRLKTNSVLEEMAGILVNRKPGPRPEYTREYLYELGEYGAAAWDQAHRVVLVVIDDPPEEGELDFGPRHFFIVTSYDEKSMPAKSLLEHYRRRGTFEDRIGEFNDAIDLSLPHREFRKNEVLLQLGVFALNILNVIRGELEPEVGGLDMGRVQKRVLKAGAWIVNRGRRLMMFIAETAMGWWEILTERLSKFCVAEPRRLRRRRFVPAPSHAFLDTPPPILE